MRILLPALLFFVILTQGAAAQEETGKGGHLAMYAGSFDVLDSESYVQVGAEYRFADIGNGFRPTVGINVDDESAGYLYGGVNLDIPLGSTPFLLTPNFMVGLYTSGSGKDLGGAVEFRSGLEASYRTEADHRIGVAFNHISNASLYDRNPGAEALLFVYQLPLPY